MKIIGKILPTRLISTFLGTGYLPAWQNHWAAVLSLILGYVLFYLIYGMSYVSYGILVTGAVVASLFLKISLGLIVISIISIFVFQSNNSADDRSDIIVVQIALGQLLVVALSMPAILAIYNYLAIFYSKICQNIFMCPSWFNDFMHFLMFFLIPFVFFNILDIIKPWPISSLQILYNNCFSIVFEGLVLVIYTLIVMYLVAFICFDLTIRDAVALNSYIFTLLKFR
ncbi:phosphatidylglycerophosphatase A family protein [Ehrlichia chaffeensis str. Heartland]|uniref:Phosphatidylglycerophosphatase A n=2 Tax=Ehrlichia chaffeensis TaxID=945 RepID=Q2GFW3_EHRCR|nr:putative phosphatidylglycerophosphatase A [Ehrlichia chaffeensis str. Arkansas]AHX03918.1 phosphatidylglycerophosphatase A family protein [Ehrlichia chaffeensis str. Heartland]AHX05353.1 phosphatidylglycerophosphatase A family protein [Ehrlichia chaffeensis str. Jax]AHX06340.1 phosphatidylglycerophosphatase A family protein [Ehrlichia chaffeensis str. Liberty]AHX07864.1 phosphatidylglycerophosphatase A family protein [Ehrlichia chaffeensis str. Osceola]AHX08202.1 phosphatidylglycerophosphat